MVKHGGKLAAPPRAWGSGQSPRQSAVAADYGCWRRAHPEKFKLNYLLLKWLVARGFPMAVTAVGQRGAAVLLIDRLRQMVPPSYLVCQIVPLLEIGKWIIMSYIETSFIMKLFHFVWKTSNNGTIWQNSVLSNCGFSVAVVASPDPTRRKNVLMSSGVADWYCRLL
jgi:hypothetical protein